MASTKAPRALYRCSECGWESAKWVGRCGECQTWASVVEVASAGSGTASRLSLVATPTSATAVPIGQVAPGSAPFRPTGVSELDRVLGGGLVHGAAVLLAGEPGVGKSTLLLEVAAQAARGGRRTLYVTGEEAVSQVRLRADRTDSIPDEL